MAVSVCRWDHVKLARLAGCIGRYTRGNRKYRWITRLFYAMAHLLSAGNGAAWNRLGTSILISGEYNPQTLYTGQTCNRLLEPETCDP